MIYEDRAVAFVDILGFQDKIASTIDENGNEIPEKTKQIDDFFTEITKEFTSEKKWSTLPDTCTRIVTHFSDTIIFSVKASQKDGILFMLDYIHYLLYTGINYGIIFRGGITYGKVCHSEDRIYGPAMISAYKLESNEAKFPRVIIQEKVIQSIFENIGEQAGEEDVDKYLSTLINQDTDDCYYLDYFSNIIDELEYAIDKYNYSESIRLIIQNLDAKIFSLAEGDFKNNLLQKSIWLKTKYNELLDQQKAKDYPEDYIDDDGFNELGSYFMSLQQYEIESE